MDRYLRGDRRLRQGVDPSQTHRASTPVRQNTTFELRASTPTTSNRKCGPRTSSRYVEPSPTCVADLRSNHQPQLPPEPDHVDENTRPATMLTNQRSRKQYQNYRCRSPLTTVDCSAGLSKGGTKLVALRTTCETAYRAECERESPVPPGRVRSSVSEESESVWEETRSGVSQISSCSGFPNRQDRYAAVEGTVVGDIKVSATFDEGSESSHASTEPGDASSFGRGTVLGAVVDVQDSGTEVTLNSIGIVRDSADSIDSRSSRVRPPLAPLSIQSLSDDANSIVLSDRATSQHGGNKFSGLAYISKSFSCGISSTIQDAADGVAEIMRRDSKRTPAISSENVPCPTSQHGPRSDSHSSSPVQAQDQGSPLGARLTCGKLCWTEGTELRDASGSVVVERQQSLERTIGGLLGSPLGVGWCDGWQAWSSLQMEDECNAAQPGELRRVLRNRAFDMNARARRIQSLKDNISPVAWQSLLDEAENGLVNEVKKTQSFSMKEGPSASIKSQRPTTPPTDVSASVASMGSAVWDSVQSCGGSSINNASDDSPLRKGKGDAGPEEDLCYDSDPEEFTHRRSESTTPNGKQEEVAAFLQNGAWTEGVSAMDVVADNQRNPKQRTRRNKPTRDFDFTDEHLVLKAMEETMNERMTLVWHRDPDVHGKDCSPVAVKAWIELGSQLRTALIQPKLMWKPVGNSHAKANRGILNADLNSIDLLDISRILEVDRIDRRRYLLAKRTCSFIAETFDRTVLFETSSEDERNRIVRGLKLLVARLGSKIIVGDARVFEEFFTPFGTTPGAPPAWATRD